MWGLQQGVNRYLQHHHKPQPPAQRDGHSPFILQSGALLVGECLPELAQPCFSSGFKRANFGGGGLQRGLSAAVCTGEGLSSGQACYCG